MKLSRFLTFALVLIMCFSIIGCDISELQGNLAVPLSVPTNVRVDGAVLSWNFVEHAIGYTVKIVNGENADINNTVGREIAVSETQYSLATLADGKYTVGVKARGDSVLYSNSDYVSVQYTRTNDTGAQYDDEVTGAFGSFDEINTKNSFLGYGIDIINASAITSKNVMVNYPIFDMDKLMNETLLKSNEHYNSFESIEAKTIEEFSQNMSTSTSITSGANVSAKGNIYGVDASASASLTSGLANSFTKTSDLVESQHFLEIIAENQSYWLILQSSEQRYKELISDEFKADLYNKSITPAQLFGKYGTHMLTSVAMGGNICMYYTMYSYDKNVSTSEYAEVSSTLKTNVEAAYGGYSAGAGSENSFESAFTYQTKAHSYGIQIDKKIISAGGGSFGINSEATLYDNYYEWQKSLDLYPVVIGVKDTNSLYPIWNLLDLNIAGAAERYNELYTYFQKYGAESYNALCEAYSITPTIAPAEISNITVGTHVNYSENQTVNVKSGETFQITFDVLPDNANKYQKNFAVDNTELASIDSAGIITISQTAPGGSYINVSISAGSVSRRITLYVINTYNINFNTRVNGLSVPSLYGVLEGYSIDEPDIAREGYYLDGWYTDSANTDKFDFENDCVTSHMTLYAKWLAIKPVVNFITGEGSKIDSQTLAYKGIVTKPKTPTLSGYVFDGWYTDEECTETFDFTTAITSDITLYAKWQKTEITVSFVTNGGTPVASTTTDITKGYKITEPITVKQYYVLDGWYRDEYFTQKFYFDSEITSDTTLYAKWSTAKAIISFVDSDGTSAVYDELGLIITNRKTDVENEFKITAPIPTKTGYTFGGWYLNGILVDLVNYDEFKPNDNGYTLVAKWIVNNYIITYKINGDIYKTETYEYGQEISPIIVNEIGYTFSGWSYKDTPHIPATMPERDIELTGSLTLNKYKITYYVDGEFYTESTFSFGEKIVYIDEPVSSGKEFSGWKYNEGSLPISMPAKNMRVDGGFNQVEFKVSYYVDGVLNYEVNVNVGFAIPVYAQEKTGYSFSGWVVTDGSDQSPLPETMPAHDLKVYGSFNINSYTITFNTNGGNRIQPITLEFGTAFAFPDDPIRLGYTFTGWDKEFTEIPAENVTVNATWNINQYTIVFNTNGGNEISSITQNYGTAITKPANPVKTGYTFAGWDKAIPSTMPAEDMAITASWSINQYTIYFDTDGGSEISAITQDYGTAIIKPISPVRTGYKFVGWDITIPSTMPAANITITAIWDLYTSNISYDINSTTTVNGESMLGEFNTRGSITSVSYNVTQLNDADAVTYSGYYDFLGWYTNATGGIQLTDENGKLKANVTGYTDAEGKWICETYNSITLYAHWEQTYAGIYIHDDFGFENVKSTGTYYIIEDIIFPASWTPMSSFSGTIDGLNHTISNATITIGGWKTEGSVTGGIFKELTSNAVIRNVRFANITVSLQNNDYTSGISNKENIVYVGVLCGKNNGTIDGVELDGCELSSYFYKYEAGGTGIADKVTHAGGVAGINYGTIINSSVKDSIVSAGSKSGTTGRGKWNYIGGICGTNVGYISACESASNTLQGITYEGKTGHYISDFAGINSGNIESNCKAQNNTIEQ